jgi:hypothetical protein
MTEKIFDSAFLGRLALITGALEQEGLEANDPHPLDAGDYETIYTAYEESGGDPAVAKKRIALTKERRDQAFGQILQFVSDQYGCGPIERLGDRSLKDLARDAFHATECWMDEVEMHASVATRGSPLQLLLKTHYQLNEAMLDMHDQILWPIAKRIFPEG